MVIANVFDNVGYITCVVSIMLQCFYAVGRMWRLTVLFCPKEAVSLWAS